MCVFINLQLFLIQTFAAYLLLISKHTMTIPNTSSSRAFHSLLQQWFKPHLILPSPALKVYIRSHFSTLSPKLWKYIIKHIFRVNYTVRILPVHQQKILLIWNNNPLPLIHILSHWSILLTLIEHTTSSQWISPTLSLGLRIRSGKKPEPRTCSPTPFSTFESWIQNEFMVSPLMHCSSIAG